MYKLHADAILMIKKHSEILKFKSKDFLSTYKEERKFDV